MSTPPSPALPKPNEEVGDIPEGVLPPQTLQNIDLNPELDDGEDASNSSKSIGQEREENAQGEGVEVENSSLHSENSRTEFDVDMSASESSNSSSNGNNVEFDGGGVFTESRQPTTEQRDLGPGVLTPSSDDLLSDDSDMNLEPELVGPSFEEEYGYSKNALECNFREPLDSKQQSKFVNYIDERLLHVQRKFVKNQADTATSYRLDELVQDLTDVVNLIWYSISPTSSLFGQHDYLIKILGDLEDYLSYYSIYDESSVASVASLDTSLKSLAKLFRFLQGIDVKLSLLADGYIMQPKGTIEKLSGTQLVRVTGITSRIRIIVVSKMEKLGLILNGVIAEDSRKSQPDTNRQSAATTLRALLEMEIGRLFEGLLERC